jgi:hypothetical protein
VPRDRIKKDEAKLKSDFIKEIKAHSHGVVIIHHEDVRTSGIPDISITFNGRTTWWELKHATPQFDSPGIQELTMLRLNAHGFARYLIYYESKVASRQTLIVDPKYLDVYETLPEMRFSGFNSCDLIHQVMAAHKR